MFLKPTGPQIIAALQFPASTTLAWFNVGLKGVGASETTYSLTIKDRDGQNGSVRYVYEPYQRESMFEAVIAYARLEPRAKFKLNSATWVLDIVVPTNTALEGTLMTAYNSTKALRSP